MNDLINAAEEAPNSKRRLTIGEFKDISAAINSLAVVIGLVVGGFWTYRTFGGFEQVESLLDISVAATQIDDPVEKTPYLNVVATIVNHGKRVEEVPVPQNPLRVFWVDPKNSRSPGVRPDASEGPGWRIQTNFETTASLLTSEKEKHLSRPPKILLLPSVTKTFAFLVPVSGAGVYYVTLTLPRHDGTAWTAGTFAVVNPASSTSSGLARDVDRKVR